MPKKIVDEVITENLEVNSIIIHGDATHGGVLLEIKNPAEGAESHLAVDDATFYVPGKVNDDKKLVKVNLFKLITWFRTSKDVAAEVDRLPGKYMKVKTVRFSTPEAREVIEDDGEID